MSLNHRSPDGVELRAIPGFPDYFAGDDGEVYSCKNGRKLRRITGGFFIANTGARYRTHQVFTPDGVRKNLCRHFLIALAWLGPRPEGKVTDHINGDSEDNRPENLRYCTHKENTNNPNSRTYTCRRRRKLTDEDIAGIVAMIARGVPQREIAAEYGVAQPVISYINSGKRVTNAILARKLSRDGEAA